MPSTTLSLAHFLGMVRQRAGSLDMAAYRDPAGEAKTFISAASETSEARMLARVVAAIRERDGEFTGELGRPHFPARIMCGRLIFVPI